MKLEHQVAALAELGLRLEAGLGIPELLHSFDRAKYEARPFELLLFMLGAEVEAEPWGRRFCNRVWNFDTECIVGTGAYVAIAKQLARVAGRPDALTGLRDHVDLESGDAWLEYTIDGKERHWAVELNDDWADMMVVAYVMDDLERDGFKFRAKDNGQAMVLYYLDDATTKRLSALANQELSTMVPE